jgi:enolase-phosphatase E1
LLDIEGTTTPIDFVHQTLFGYARARVGDFLQRHWNDPEVRADVAQLQREHAAELPEAFTSASSPPVPSSPSSLVAYVCYLMDQDRKSTGLKSLQGKIWEEGYRSGELKGEVYPDVLPALQRWHGQGVDIAIFSSGSVQAQQSLFRNSVAGDLTRFLRDYFDTTTGPKREPESYARIASALEHSPTDILFVSDIGGELDAALAAGMRTALCVRTPGSVEGAGVHRVIHGLNDITPLAT